MVMTSLRLLCITVFAYHKSLSIIIESVDSINRDGTDTPYT